jgi:hypothetical protein
MFLSLLGLIFAGVGGCLVFVEAPATVEEANWLEAQTPPSRSILIDVPVGERVLVEGRVSGRNPIQYASYVAYIVDECETDSDGDRSCQEIQRVTPPLLLNMAGGLVEVINADYDLRGDLPEVYEADWEYRGLNAEMPVVAVGLMAPRDGNPKLEAEYLAPGTQADYVAFLRSDAVTLRILGVVFGLLGLGLFAVMIFITLRGLI